MNGYKEMVLSHSAKGHKWKNHKYIGTKIGKNGRVQYIYKSSKNKNVTVNKVALPYQNGVPDMWSENRDRYLKRDINVLQDLSDAGRKNGDAAISYFENAKSDSAKQLINSKAAKQRKASYKAKIKYYAAVNKAKKYAKKGKEAVKKFIDKNIKKTFTVNKNQIILPDSGARVTFK